MPHLQPQSAQQLIVVFFCRFFLSFSSVVLFPKKNRLCSQRSERGSSLVSLTGSTWRQEDVVLLEPFWDSCDAMDCQEMAWFKSNGYSNFAPHPATSPGPSFPSA